MSKKVVKTIQAPPEPKKKKKLSARGKKTIAAILIATGFTAGTVAYNVISEADTIGVELTEENKNLLNTKLKIGNKDYYDYEQMFNDLYYQSMIQGADLPEIDRKGQEVLDNQTCLFLSMCFSENPEIQNAINNNNGNIEDVDIKIWYESLNGETNCYIRIGEEVYEAKSSLLKDVVINGAKARAGKNFAVDYNENKVNGNLSFKVHKGPHSLKGANKTLNKTKDQMSKFKYKKGRNGNNTSYKKR